MEMHMPRQTLKMILSLIKSLSGRGGGGFGVQTPPQQSKLKKDQPVHSEKAGYHSKPFTQGTATITAQTKRVL